MEKKENKFVLNDKQNNSYWNGKYSKLVPLVCLAPCSYLWNIFFAKKTIFSFETFFKNCLNCVLPFSKIISKYDDTSFFLSFFFLFLFSTYFLCSLFSFNSDIHFQHMHRSFLFFSPPSYIIILTFFLSNYARGSRLTRFPLLIHFLPFRRWSKKNLRDDEPRLWTGTLYHISSLILTFFYFQSTAEEHEIRR